MILLDLFSGIGGFHTGLEQSGFKFEKVLFSEIDKHSIANYRYNFKDSQYAGSVVNIRGNNIPRPNVITFGSPCQDFSLSGKRKGLEGNKSSLIKHAIRLIDETRPDVFIWENVKGTFSSNDGTDFWAIIQTFTNIGGYRLEWQLLNTTWFLPQNRERIYLIGHLAGRSSPGVFPIGRTFQVHFSGTTDKKEIYLPASTLTARQYSNWAGNYIKYGKYQQDRLYSEYGLMSCLLSKDGERHTKTLIGDRIRKLTEVECERLQGFKDDWTKYGDYNGEIKEIAKTHRYRMLGNAVTVDVVKAVGMRLINRMSL